MYGKEDRYSMENYILNCSNFVKRKIENFSKIVKKFSWMNPLIFVIQIF